MLYKSFYFKLKYLIHYYRPKLKEAFDLEPPEV